MLNKNVIGIFLLLLFPWCASAQTITPLKGFTGIKGQVFDGVMKKPLSARIEVRDTAQKIQATYYYKNKLEGIFTEEDGTFSIPLKPGVYGIKIVHGIDHLIQEHTFTVKENEGVKAVIFLQPWINLKQRGWLNGDGHAHLYSDKKSNDTIPRQVRKICLAQGVDFISACQGWGGFNDNTWRAAYAKVSDDKFNLYYGAEMPKYRTGHVWWLGLSSTLGNFENLMDTVYENQYYQAFQHTEWDYSWLKFKFIPDVEVIPRYSKSQDAMAIIAHPTSWWMQQRGDISKYTTNVVGNLSFGLLSGNIWSGMTVMGYMNDNYYYQNIWFHLLNEGYIMPPFSELDGGYPDDNKFYYGQVRTYYLASSAASVDGIRDAVRKGHTFVTSGPAILADIDNQYQVGDVVPLNGNTNKLHINAYASGDPADHLSYVVVFRNGKVFRLWDLRDKKPREFSETLSLSEKENAWYVVKAYGREAWDKPENIDVMAYCDAAEKSAVQQGFPGGRHSVAITSPFYFRFANEVRPRPLQSKIDLTVVSPATGKPVDGQVDVMLTGEKINSFRLINGRAQFSMPVNALLKISAAGYPTITRGLYTDYVPYLNILERIANGKWREKDNWKNTINGGQVPWSVFEFEKTKAVLSAVKWEIKFEANEREGLWKDFDGLF
ncbi:hypothetical protein GFS24_05315 [Chitinophaga sp. SYP-B3965]|uniref:CehA/McbA family metallohydrolase n=1 Tax=Chitinophaga sp. SYP-B3965 TaxID=2663120 RepID=UPI0012996708|nr:CehA/McbA family metallohydrolase [Chitinophaga sp. SYP-B3965]MRG44520.1 hypothetical protein [Chitinophaga sp. SYP-B3965]